MRLRIVQLLALLVAMTSTSAGVVLAASPAHAKDQDCSDFGSQAAAQSYFLNHGGPNSDPDGLDADGDGVACESNPCPCSSDTGGGGGGNNSPAAVKKFHTISLRVEKVGGRNKALVVGRVSTYRGTFQVQRKLAGAQYRLFKRARAVNPGGKVRASVAGSKRTCFKVIVPASERYKLTSKVIGCM